MSNRRLRIIALQAVVVGVGLLVVYLTLLRPEEHRPLFGVGTTSGSDQVAQAPGGGGQAQGQLGGGGAAATGGGGHRAGAHGGRGEGGRHRAAGNGGGGRASRSGGATGGVAGAAVSEAAALPIPTRGGAQGGVTPSEEQYDDTVDRLFGNL